MVAYVRSHPEKFLDKPEDAPEYNKENDITNGMEQLESELEQLRKWHSSMIQENPRPDTAKMLDQMRKWNCHFDGRDLYTFLERIEELQRAYVLSDEQILRGFTELLQGDAQLWFQNFQVEYDTLEKLKNGLRNFYLSLNKLRHLNRQINDWQQGATEKIRSFVTALMTLMRRRRGYSSVGMGDVVRLIGSADYFIKIIDYISPIILLVD